MNVQRRSMQAISSALMLATFLAFLVNPTAARAADGFLAARAKSKAETSLRSSISKLASALQKLFGDKYSLDSDELPILVADTRDLLRHEADRLYGADGADLLRRFADRAPASVLVIPLTQHVNTHPHSKPPHASVGRGMLGQEQTLTSDEEQPLGHSVFDQTIIRSENGKSVAETTHCKDGKCNTSKSTGEAAGTKPFHGLQDTHNAVHEAAGAFAGALKAMRDENGLGSLDDFFRGATAHQKSLLKDGQGSESHAESSTSSVSSEVIKNGKRVKVTKTCNNGACRETIEKSDLGSSGDSDFGAQGNSGISAPGPLLLQPSIFGDDDLDDSAGGFLRPVRMFAPLW